MELRETSFAISLRRLRLYVFHIWMKTFVFDLESERSGNPEWPHALRSSFDARRSLKSLVAFEQEVGQDAGPVFSLVLEGTATGPEAATSGEAATGAGAATGARAGVSLRPVGRVQLDSPARPPAKKAAGNETGDSSEARDESTFSIAECKAVDTAGASGSSGSGSGSGLSSSDSDVGNNSPDRPRRAIGLARVWSASGR